jgi:cell filamentation protein
VVEDQIITVAELSEWHRKWLGNIYEWAGQERSVNMSKGDFHFATVAQIPRLLAELDKKYLSVYTPCQGFNESRLVEAIAIVHVELILVHPFREGNGRLSRLLANVMALQAGWPELDFSAWDAASEDYFAAIRAGMDCNYEPLKALVKQVLNDSENAVL